ncbi:MAG: NAD(P)-dependent oxidoreductase [Rhodospirillales bacterium]|nr:NAD(P)-dependent oxidoreductase [Rhodospirillales bacterium]
MPSKKVAIVTGVSSFVGMHLARTFAGNSWGVSAVTSRPVSTYDGIRAQRLAAISQDVNLVQCALSDTVQIAKLINDTRPDVWVHHAAYADNYTSRDYDLGKSFAMNVVALEPLYKNLAGTKCGVIVTGSSWEYTSSDQADLESDVCWPDMPYGVSKLAETVESHRLALLYDVPTRVARIYMPVGTYDVPGKLIDSVISALLKGDSIDLSPCTQQRDFLGVNDIAGAYLKLADDFSRQIFDIFNICSGEAKELRELLEELCSITGADPVLLKFGVHEMRPGEAMVLYGDNAKAATLLGWQPKPIEKTLRSLIK